MKTQIHPRRKSQINYFFILVFLIFFSADIISQPIVGFTKIAGTLVQPLEIKNAGDGTGRLFVAEQGGKIKIYKNGNLQSSPFLDVSSLVGIDQFQGIWSIAFSPAYKKNGLFYMFYTDKKGTTALARYKVSTNNPDIADPNSAIILLSYPKAGAGHYGNLSFGSDGYLYVSLGAGGNNKTSQDGQSHFGKMIRINVNVNTPPYYSIPADNPFINDSSILNEIWAMGLRNAWRWSFDKTNDDMWIADVGQDSMEEVDYRTKAQGLAGSNFGWQCFEGTLAYKPKDCGNKNNYVFPIFEYHHDTPTGGECLIGGYVYRGTASPALKGYYICADFISANLWEIKPDGSGGWITYIQQKGVPKGITSFGQDENGELYAVSNKSGALYNLSSTGFADSDISSPIFSSTHDNHQSVIYPTFVENSMITLDLKEQYESVRIVDLSGREVMKQYLNGNLGKTVLHLSSSNLRSGIYIVECTGKHKFQQKIYFRQ